MIAGVRQSDLARKIGISASYLNLIEHNRRRIGGKLLVNIAQELRVEPSMLTEGAEAALVSTLREAAADAGALNAEADKAEEFAGRFPGWAEVLALEHRRVASLERTVEALSDRLTHDPHLAGSLHEVLSTAASIRSVASILAETDELDADWSDRFHRNLNQDSLRLAESSKALMAYLDDTATGDDFRRVPREEAEAFLAERGHHFPELENDTETPEELVRQATGLGSAAARQIALGLLEQYQSDARRLPLPVFRDAIAEHGADPDVLIQVLKADLSLVLRRLAAMPLDVMPAAAGLVVCDNAGGILFRKTIGGFAMPRSGAPCPLWPLFTALGRPLVPVRRRIAQLGRSPAVFDCIAYAEPRGLPGVGEDPLYQSVMLYRLVESDVSEAGKEVMEVGSSCRVCSRRSCKARREPSILREGF